MKLDFISIRIASKGYTIYKMSPMTATRIMTAIDVKKEPDESKACIAAMAYSVALAIVGSREHIPPPQGMAPVPSLYEAKHLRRAVRLLSENLADDSAGGHCIGGRRDGGISDNHIQRS